jgi:uncharacterized repeat protein (TIGR01451 family)
MTLRPVLRCAAGLAAAALLACAPPQPEYRAIELPPLPGDVASGVHNLNDADPVQVAGWSRNAQGVERAVLWYVGQNAATPVALPPLSSVLVESEAWDVNDAGVAVGVARMQALNRGVRWEGGQASDLTGDAVPMESLDSKPYGVFPRAITNTGLVVGRVRMALPGGAPGQPGPYTGFKQRGSTFTAIAGLHDARAVVERGTSAALAGVVPADPPEGLRAVAVEAGPIELTSLGGESYSFDLAMAEGSDASLRGYVPGSSTTPAGERHPVLWTLRSGPTVEVLDLGALPGGGPGIALGANGAGTVVGTLTGEPARAFVWSEADGLRELDALLPATNGWQLEAGVKINRAGFIAGEGRLAGQPRGFVLAPEPPPPPPVVVEVELVKEAPAEVTAGSELVVTFRITNPGADPVTVTVFENPLPDGTACVADPAPWDCAGGIASLEVTVAGGAEETRELRLQVTADPGTVLRNEDYGLVLPGNLVLANFPVVETTVVPVGVSVVLDEPAACTELDPGGGLSIRASASSTGGPIARVDFVSGGAVLASDATSPYEAQWSGLPAGIHCVQAVAVDAAGNQGASEHRCVVVGLATATLAYDVAELVSPDGSGGQAEDINEAGVVAGSGTQPETPCIWPQPDAPVCLPVPGVAYGIDDLLQVTGRHDHSGPPNRSWFVWQAPNGSFQTSQNAGGQGGELDFPTFGAAIREHAFLVEGELFWGAGLPVLGAAALGAAQTDLLLVGSPPGTSAYYPGRATPGGGGINAGYEVAATTSIGLTPGSLQSVSGWRAALWPPVYPAQPNQYLHFAQVLGTLGGNSFGMDLNDRSWVVGTSEIAPGGPRHAFLWTPDTQAMQDIHSLGITSVAREVNNPGLIVGSFETAGGAPRAFLHACESAWDLNDLIDSTTGWTLEHANAINDNGWIAGAGTLAGDPRGFLLMPRTAGD